MSSYLSSKGNQPSAFLFHLQNEKGFEWLLLNEDYILLKEETAQACLLFAELPDQPLIGTTSFSGAQHLDVCRYEWDHRLNTWTETYPEKPPCQLNLPLDQVVINRTERIYQFEAQKIMVEDIRLPKTGSGYLRVSPVIDMQEFERLCAANGKVPTQVFQHQYRCAKSEMTTRALKDLLKKARADEYLAELTELPGAIFRRERQAVIGR